MDPRLVTLVNGRKRIDDMTEDAPLVTFHGSPKQTELLAEVFMAGLKAMEDKSNG